MYHTNDQHNLTMIAPGDAASLCLSCLDTSRSSTSRFGDTSKHVQFGSTKNTNEEPTREVIET